MFPFTRRWRERSQARAAYFAADKKLADLHNYLGDVEDPRERAKALRKMADLEMDQCWGYRAAFGSRDLDDSLDMVKSLMYSSMLYRVLADVEHVVACNGKVGRNWRIRELGEAADEVIDRMVATPDRAERAALLEDLYDAVVDTVGGQAAEVLGTLPSPGHSGWLAREDKLRPLAGKD